MTEPTHESMSLPTDEPQSHGGVEREELHVRRIEMRGFRRSDGLYEVEGRLTDQKPHDFAPPSGGRTIPADAALHDMRVTLVFGDDMVVREVRTQTVAAPYRACPEAGRALQSLVGVLIGGGWSREVRSRLSGVQSCIHLMEMLLPMATAAIQSLGVVRLARPDPLDKDGRPRMIDSCYAYDAGGEVVLNRWPQFHRSGVDNAR